MKLTIVLLVASLMIGPAVTLAANKQPSAEDLHRLFDEGKYSELLPKLNGVLALKGDAASPYDRYDLLLLKAETFVRLKNNSSARDTFEAAAREAPDKDHAALARATIILLGKSYSFAYTPKTATPGAGRAAPINIVDPATRKSAMAALLADELGLAQRRAEPIKKNNSLDAIAGLIPTVQELSLVELAATGDDAETKAMLDSLMEQAKTILSAPLKKMEARADEIARMAAQIPEGSRGVPRGLIGTEGRDLLSIIAGCKDVHIRAKAFSKKLGDAGEPFRKLAAEAEGIATDANKTLNTSYERD